METVEYETPKEFRSRMHKRRIKEAQKESYKKKNIITEEGKNNG